MPRHDHRSHSRHNHRPPRPTPRVRHHPHPAHRHHHIPRASRGRIRGSTHRGSHTAPVLPSPHPAPHRHRTTDRHRHRARLRRRTRPHNPTPLHRPRLQRLGKRLPRPARQYHRIPAPRDHHTAHPTPPLAHRPLSRLRHHPPRHTALPRSIPHILHTLILTTTILVIHKLSLYY